MRRLSLLLIPAFFVLFIPTVNADPPAGLQSPPAKSKAIIVLVDRSGSIEQLEDTTQAFTTHLLKLAELSGEPVAVAVIFFGGDGVRVVPANGMPTVAHKSLHQELLKNWPKPNGGTPMDAAFQEAVRMVKALPQGIDITILLFTDGEPDSGWLRPEAFAEVKAELDRRVKTIQANPKNLPPEIVQDQLVALEQEVKDPRTELAKKLYALQLKAEFKATLDHAQTLKQAKVRFVSVDYIGGIPELKQIHDAGGGQANDLVIAKPPVTAIAKMHHLGLTALPRVVVQDPLSFPADPKSFERAILHKLDPLGERALITFVFDQPLVDFASHALLEATFGGNTVRFNPDNDDPSRTLSFDSAGKVVAAHLLLDPVPDDRQVTLMFRSPSNTMSVPACTAYVHLRLTKDLAPQFRPHHVPADATGPFRVSPNQPVRWNAAYRTPDNAKPVPLRSVEAILRNIHTGTEIRLDTRSDPQVAFTFETDPQRLPRGVYDVQLKSLLQSGGRLTTVLPKHVDSQEGDEWMVLDVVQKTGPGVENASHLPGHVDFGELGDERDKATVALTVRTIGIDYDVSVEVGVDGLTDAHGKPPKKPWIVPDRKKLILKPGRAELLKLTIKLPEIIEDEIGDGRFQAHLHFLRTDLGEPMQVRRFQRITGVPDDEPANLVSFTLRRPKLEIRAPRCFRNMLITAKDGHVSLPVAASLAKPFERSVTLTATHDSVIPRQLTVSPEGTFVDHEGKRVPYVRLIPVDGGQVTQEIQPGAQANWTFIFQVDQPFDLHKAIGKITVSSPGLPPVHITVDVAMRRPLLGATVRWVLWILGIALLVAALIALLKWLRARGFREGGEIAVTEDRPLKGVLSVNVAANGQVSLIANQPLAYGFGDEPKKRLGENRPLPITAGSLTVAKPLMIAQVTSDGEEGWSIAMTDLLPEPPELRGEIQAAPEQTHATAHQRRRTLRYLLLASLTLVVAWAFFTGPVVRAFQWLFDLCNF